MKNLTNKIQSSKKNSKITKKKTNKIIKNTEKIETKKVLKITFLILIIALVVSLIFGIFKLVNYFKYKYYTEKMYEYGYSELYDERDATSSDSFKKIEAIKVAIGSLQNTKDVSKIYFGEKKYMSDNEKWYNYALNLGIISTIKFEDIEKEATVSDMVSIVKNTISILLEEDSIYITDSNSKRTAKKGELNKIIVETVDKFSLRYYKNNYLMDKVSIVTDKSKMPKNSGEFPYIVDNIPKEIYELEYKVEKPENYENPKTVYSYMGNLYGSIDYVISSYYGKILNIDYETITYSNFLNSIRDYTIYNITEEDIKDYVDYVKEHKIKLEGSIVPLLPIIYNNGRQFVVRSEIVFNVVNSDTTKNILYGDENLNIEYTGNSFKLYVDVPLGTTLNSLEQLIYVDSISNNMVKIVNGNITIQE